LERIIEEGSMSWEMVRLGDICKVVGGTTPSTNNAEYWNGDTIWLSPTDLPEVGTITTSLDSKRKITSLAVEKCGFELLPVNSIVFSTRASIGKIGIVDKPLCTNQGFTNLVPSSNVHSKYLAYALKNNIRNIEKLGNSTTFNEVSRTAIRNFQIPLPPLPTQKRIAEILDAADALRRKDQELLKKYDELAQAIFIDMFGDPEYNPNKYPIVNLEDLCEHIIDCPHSTPIHTDKSTEFPCIRTSEMKNGKIVWEKMKFLDFDNYIERTKRLKPLAGDIVYAREGTYGEAVILPSGHNFALGQRTMLLRTNSKKCDNYFFWFLINSEFVYKQAKRKNMGSTVGHVNVADVKKFKMTLPPVDIQIKFGDIIKNSLALSERINGRHFTSELFNSLLQQAFNSELVP
jgi:type I restriction enzyme, S subunit